MMTIPHANVSNLFRLTIAGCLGAILLMAIAWGIYPESYPWLERDLSTLGRIFTINGNGQHQNFSVYNFGLLLWGMSAVTFFTAKAMLQETRAAVNRTLICGILVGLGVIAIGIVPADASNHFLHSLGSLLAIASLATVIWKASASTEPWKRFWSSGLLVAAAAYGFLRIIPIPYGNVLLQKLFVLFIFLYLIVQSITLLFRLTNNSLRISSPAVSLCATRAPVVLQIGVWGMVFLMGTAIAVFPGGFDWQNHWTSRLGNLFMTPDDIQLGEMYSRYMIYNYALAWGGTFLTAFWSIRAAKAKTRLFSTLILFAGLIMGTGLAGIGMAPTQALGLHRLCINLLIVSVFLVVLLMTTTNSGSISPKKYRWISLLILTFSAIAFHFLGPDWGKFGQKIMIAEVVAYLLIIRKDFHDPEKES